MTDDHDIIGNAASIIERFGGIRPMATKLDIPVTTVQGWKQRNAIPGARRDEIRAAAARHDVDLDGLLDAPGDHETGSPRAQTSPVSETFDSLPLEPAPRKEPFDRAMHKNTTARPLFYGGMAMLAAAIVGAVFAVAPHVKNMGQQNQRVAELEAEIERLRQEQAAASPQAETSYLPDNVRQALAGLETKVSELSAQAQNYTSIIDDLKTGDMQQRLTKLEGHISEIVPQARILGLSGLMQKVQAMQQTAQGSTSLDGLLKTMLAQMEAGTLDNGQAPGQQQEGTAGTESGSSSLEPLLATDPVMAQTFEGVAPQDIKAAAMLIAMAQMRDSLARGNDSFDTDLQILKMTAAKDDPELQAAIDRLAPRARQGVLTPDGLSREFRSLAGDIVAASLSGEDVSVQEKLRARMNDMMVVEKGGQQISGTQTQKIIAQAQARLDQGDVKSAVDLLKTLDGPAAQKSQPFIDSAEATLAANQLQQVLGQNIVTKLQVMLHDPKSINAQSLNGLMGQVQTLLPNTGIIPTAPVQFPSIPQGK